MTRSDFDDAIGKICAAFVFDTPSTTTLDQWYSVAGHIPEGGAAAWVVREFMRRKSRIYRGDNISKELVDLYEEYRKERQINKFRAEAAKQKSGCPDCSAVFPGWIHVHVRAHGDEPESWPLLKCACNSDPRFMHKQGWTREQIHNFPHMEILT